jgi:O-antigen/teichoic acid export membrane protein
LVARISVKNAVGTLASQIAIQAIGLITGILVARLLGPEGRGEVAAVIAWASVITYLGDLGLPIAYTYAAAREPARRRQLLGNALVATPVQWLLLGVGGMLVLQVALARHGQSVVHIATLYLWAYIPLNLVTRYVNAIQQGTGNYLAFNAVRLCVPASYLAFLTLIIGVGMGSVQGVLICNLLSFAVTALVALGFALKYIKQLRPSRVAQWIDPRGFRRDLRYGLSAHVGTLQPFTNLQLDVLVLTALLSAHDLGLYMVALAGAAVLKAQGNALGLVVLPDIAKQRDRYVQQRLLARYVWIIFLLGGATAILAFAWAEPLVRFIYGSAFESAASILRVTVLGGLAGALYRVISDGLRGMGYPLSSTIVELVGMIIGLASLAVLVPIAGALGAAWAVAATSFCTLLMGIYALFQSGVRLSDLLSLRGRPSVTMSSTKKPTEAEEADV